MTVAFWWSPVTLIGHLSERCARQQGRPATAGEADTALLIDGVWCERCSSEEKRIGILDGSR